MLLEVSGLEAFYGASQALFGVDLAIDHGEVVALLGRNGVGLPTMLRGRDNEIRLEATDPPAPCLPQQRCPLGVPQHATFK